MLGIQCRNYWGIQMEMTGGYSYINTYTFGVFMRANHMEMTWSISRECNIVWIQWKII